METEMTKKELEKLAAQSVDALANKMALISLTVIDVIIAIAYMAEALKGSRTFGYVGLIAFLALFPCVLGWVFYSQSSEHGAVKHIVAIGFAIMYTVALFTAANPLVFTYAIPMLIIVTLYLDTQYTAIAGSGVAVLNIIDVARKIAAGVDSATVPMLEIQALVMVLIVAYIVLTVATSRKYQAINGAQLTLEKDKTAEVLDKVLQASGGMINDINQVVGQMTELSGSVDKTLVAMSEVQAGASETANSVQDQLQKTEEIQTYANAVEFAADVIKENIDSTTQAVQDGQKCMEEMAAISEKSMKTSAQVTQALQDFKETTNKMNNITDLISSVAQQTGLLALNASIEAARAGEAGRGFAVVATEISQLANQSSSATENIVSLIGDITNQLGTMIEAINNMVSDNTVQAEAAKKTEVTFDTIVKSISEINSQSEVLAKSVADLAGANHVIIETVSTISAISEEVSAHSNDTYESSQRNQDIVSQVEQLVDSLDGQAKVLAEITS